MLDFLNASFTEILITRHLVGNVKGAVKFLMYRLKSEFHSSYLALFEIVDIKALNFRIFKVQERVDIVEPLTFIVKFVSNFCTFFFQVYPNIIVELVKV